MAFENSVQQFNTKKKGLWYHENDGYYYKQSGSRCSKVILKCIHRSCRVKGLINNDKIIRLNKHAHCHEPDFEKRHQVEEKNIIVDTAPYERKRCEKQFFTKKIEEIFRSNKFVDPIEEFSTERRGTWYHQHDGYYYRKYQVHPPKIYVECVEQNCNVTGVVIDNLSGSIVVANNRRHNHEADKDKKIVMLVRKEILLRCRNEDTALKTIYNSEIAKVDNRISTRIPYSVFKHAMAKNRLLRNPSSPESMIKFKEMIYDKMSHLTIDGEEFFLTATAKFALCISPATSVLLEDYNLAFCIDFLKCVPKKPAINHVLTIGAVLNDVLYPIMYIFMMDQSYNAYREVFNSIKEKVPLWKPKTVITEFEGGLNDILMQIFPEAVVAGNWYYFRKAVLQKSCKLILRQLINDDVNLKEIIRMLMTLPLLPANLIKAGFRTIEDNAISNKLHLIDGVLPLLAYVRKQWLFRNGVGVYLMSKTVLRTINVHEKFYESIAPFLSHMISANPNIWVFFDALKNIEHDFATKFSTQRDEPTQQSYRDVILNARSQLCNENVTIWEFLREICQLALQIPGEEENNSLIDVVPVNLNESNDEKSNINDAESVELNCNWDWDTEDSIEMVILNIGEN